MNVISIIIILAIAIVIILLIYYFWYSNRSIEQEKKIPDTIYKDTIVSTFKNISDKYGSHVALMDFGRDYSVTYREFWDKSVDTAHRLNQYFGERPRVAVCGSCKCIESFYLYMGALMSGGILMPIDVDDIGAIKEADIDLLVVDDISNINDVDIKSNIKLIIVLNETLNDKIYDESNIISYENFSNTDIESPSDRDVYPENDALIVRGSNSKICCHTHHSIMSSIQSTMQTIPKRSNIDLNIGELYMSFNKTNSIIDLMFNVFIPICSVGRIECFHVKNVKNIEDIKNIKPTILIGQPKLYKKINKELMDDAKTRDQWYIEKLDINLFSFFTPLKVCKSKIGIDRVKFSFNIGNIDENIKSDLSSYIELCCVYGTNETNIISLGVPGNSKGLGVPIVDLKIDKDTSKIMVRGDSLFSKYYKDSKYKKYKKKWFKTGDMGYIDRSGYLFLEID